MSNLIMFYVICFYYTRRCRIIFISQDYTAVDGQLQRIAQINKAISKIIELMIISSQIYFTLALKVYICSKQETQSKSELQPKLQNGSAKWVMQTLSPRMLQNTSNAFNMKASKLIEVLKRIQEEEGDVEVLVCGRCIAYVEREYFENKVVTIG